MRRKVIEELFEEIVGRKPKEDYVSFFDGYSLIIDDNEDKVELCVYVNCERGSKA